MKIHFLFFLTIWVLFALPIFSQPIINGRVFDTESKQPLAFVSISYNKGEAGTLTDINGRFQIKATNIPKSLLFSYLGYETFEIPLLKKDLTTSLNIKLVKKGFSLSTVQIIAGENPANKVIQNAILNRNLNNPNNYASYHFYTYNKFVFTADTVNRTLYDTSSSKGYMMYDEDMPELNVIQDTVKVDSSYIKLKKFLDRQHLFLTESITEKKFKNPGLFYEKVLANRISGLKNPMFTLLATQMQSFSIYTDYIEILSEKYLSPLSIGSTNKYFFYIEDTLFQEKDTVYIISYKPKKGKNFIGLKGAIYINSNKYAVQNILAEPASNEATLYVKIQQQYQLIDGLWFPKNLNTDILFKNFKVNGYSVKGLGRTSLKDVEINIPISKKEIKINGIEIEENTIKRDEYFWNSYRTDSLSKKDRNTYRVMDSIGKAEKFDQKLTIFSSLLSGRLPFGLVDIELGKLIAYNQLEGLRLGVGAITNDKVSKSWALGAYTAFGFADKQFKYGGDLYRYLNKRKDNAIILSHSFDLIESASYSFYDLSSGLLNSTRAINLLYFDWAARSSIAYRFNTTKYWSGRIVLSHTNKETIKSNPYTYLPDNSANNIGINQFNLTEVGAYLRFAFREKYVKTPLQVINLGSRYPIIWVNLSHSFNAFGGEYSFSKAELKIQKSFNIRHLGRSTLHFASGITNAGIPLTEQYFTRGTSQHFTFFVPFAFQTMYANDFLNNRFTNIFWQHSFGSLLLNNKYTAPEVVICFNAGVGSLDKKEVHKNFPVFPLRGMEKGFYETGLLVNNLYKSGLQGIGIGAFYRLGPYSFMKWSDNLAVKISTIFNF